MKLCCLLHETVGQCPCCGGKVNSSGHALDQLIFPDREGVWRDPDTGEAIRTPQERAEIAGAETRALPASERTNTETPAATERLAMDVPPHETDVVGPPGRRGKRRKPMPGTLQALLRYRKELADGGRQK